MRFNPKIHVMLNPGKNVEPVLVGFEYHSVPAVEDGEFYGRIV